MKEIAVAHGAATIRYTIPMPEDSPLRGGDAEEVALGSSPVLSTVKSGGPNLTVDSTAFELVVVLSASGERPCKEGP